jgi:hypothetical protein
VGALKHHLTEALNSTTARSLGSASQLSPFPETALTQKELLCPKLYPPHPGDSSHAKTSPYGVQRLGSLLNAGQPAEHLLLNSASHLPHRYHNLQENNQ